MATDGVRAEKGPNSYVIKAIVSWIKRLGYATVTFQHDQGPRYEA